MSIHFTSYNSLRPKQGLTFVLAVVSLILSVFLLSSCDNKPLIMQTNIDVQGHRGCRGLRPENTISAFKKAVDIGVNTLELDVVVNQFGDVIISHEPFFNHEIAIGPNGEEINEENEKSYNMFPMNLDEIQSFDVGSKNHPRFPNQKKMKISKPTLKEMVVEIESYCKDNSYDPLEYNIEIKRVKENDGVYHPIMTTFADVVIDEIKSLGIADRTSVQCFDVETLQYVHKTYPELRLVLLIQNIKPFKQNFKELGFSPWAYSPYFKLVNEELVKYCREKGIKVIPWTVNDVKDIIAILEKDVDGIISDYPDRVVELIDANN